MIIDMLRSISIINIIFSSFGYYIIFFREWNHQLKLIVYLFTLSKHMLIFFSESLILCYWRPIKWSVSKLPSSVRKCHRRYRVLLVKPPETSSEFPKRFFDRREPGKRATWSDYVKSRKRSWNPTRNGRLREEVWFLLVDRGIIG